MRSDLDMPEKDVAGMEQNDAIGYARVDFRRGRGGENLIIESADPARHLASLGLTNNAAALIPAGAESPAQDAICEVLVRRRRVSLARVVTDGS